MRLDMRVAIGEARRVTGPRVASSLFVTLLLAACASDDLGGEGQGTDDGDEPEAVTLYVETDASSVCSSGTGTVELVTRRVDCFDPPLPCTVAQDPPWIVGTTDDCGQLEPGIARYEVEVSQTGRWETRLRSSAAMECFGLAGQALTSVSKDDLASRAELMLAPGPASECVDP
jgi:hypothetical protein